MKFVFQCGEELAVEVSPLAGRGGENKISEQCCNVKKVAPLVRRAD